MVFAEKQEKITSCASGRTMVCLNEEIVSVPMMQTDEDGDREVNRDASDGTATNYAYDVYWLDGAGDVLDCAKATVLKEIVEYDKSENVNNFYLNGKPQPWKSDDDSTLNKDIRMGFRQNIKDKIALGEETIDFWLGGSKITLPCQTADMLMCSLENYAYGCFNVTAAHKKAVSELTTVEEVLAYDYRVGYPTMLKMEV